jgi:hypothetical protein
MAKIQARNVDDGLYELIRQSAMKNERTLEGEIRFALEHYYRPAGPDKNAPKRSLRECWLEDTGRRLLAAVERLSDDGLFAGSRNDTPAHAADLVRMARQLSISPGVLMDCTDGQGELTQDLAVRIESRFGVNAEWLTTGDGLMFPMVILGTYSGVSWGEFFLPDDDDNRYIFELIRIAGGRHDGTLLILRQNEQSGAIATGLVTEAFYLGSGMGSGGYGNLRTFLLFLKTRCQDVVMNAYVYEPPEPDFDFWSVMGRHHPVWFRDANRRSPSRWLQQVLNGEDPADWFTGGWASVLQEVAEATSGAATSERADSHDA